ncbi:hypothetical protein BGZ83_002618, partial [Gryganskiella cystojenkinii]
MPCQTEGENAVWELQNDQRTLCTNLSRTLPPVWCRNPMIPLARQSYNEKKFGKGKNIVDGRHYCGDMVVCKQCNALMFYSERVKGSESDPKFSLCCKSGAVTNIPTIDPDP